MDTCSICCEESRAWAVGPCEHTTCLVCSVRLRVLCDQRLCPVCREKMNKVVVTDSITKFSLPPHGSKVDRKYAYIFLNTQLYNKYKSLQLYQCNKCREKQTFAGFSLLYEHSRKVHNLLYCDICCENLKLFPYELRLYTRQELMRHRREGDPEDRSYRGHPLCQFCDNRFFDNDALHAHLRKEHFWCHFCESDGKQDYYPTYPLLRQHFRQEHYLCVEGQCQHEKLTSVFRTKLDLQVHRAKAHSRGATKAEAKQMRQLDVGFTYGRGEEGRINGGGSASVGGSVANGQWQPVQQLRGVGRPNKSRDCDTGNIQMIPRPLQTQQQRDSSNSPPLSERKQSHQHQHVYEQPPRLKQKQQQQEQQKQPATGAINNVGTASGNASKKPAAAAAAAAAITTSSSSQRKKPPGLGTSQNSVVKSTTTSEWPDLTLSAVPKEQPKTVLPPQNPGQKQKPRVVSFRRLESRQFPPLSIVTPQSCNANLAASLLQQQSSPNEESVDGSNVPPGFVNTQQWQKINQDPIYKSESSQPNHMTSMSGNVNTIIPPPTITEGGVITLVRDALDHDRDKFNYFRNLSGWYRNSEITVHDYVRRCRELFGDLKWMLIGPQLAQVMPIEGKRNELFQNVYRQPPMLSDHYPTSLLAPPEPLPLPQSAASSGSLLHVSRSEPMLLRSTTGAGKWGVLSNRVVPNWESECEYPSLHTRATSAATTAADTGRRVQPPPGVASWKTRVPV